MTTRFDGRSWVVIVEPDPAARELEVITASSEAADEQPMSSRYLEVTYREGHVFAAYLHLARDPGQKGRRSEPHEPGLVVDFDEQGRPLGVEITAPGLVTFEGFNELLERIGVEPVSESEFAPLRAA